MLFSNHQPHGCLLNRFFGCRSKKTSKLCVTGLCGGNSPGPVNSPHKGQVTRKMLPFDDVIMHQSKLNCIITSVFSSLYNVMKCHDEAVVVHTYGDKCNIEKVTNLSWSQEVSAGLYPFVSVLVSPAPCVSVPHVCLLRNCLTSAVITFRFFFGIGMVTGKV